MAAPGSRFLRTGALLGSDRLSRKSASVRGTAPGEFPPSRNPPAFTPRRRRKPTARGPEVYRFPANQSIKAFGKPEAVSRPSEIHAGRAIWSCPQSQPGLCRPCLSACKSDPVCCRRSVECPYGNSRFSVQIQPASRPVGAVANCPTIRDRTRDRIEPAARSTQCHSNTSDAEVVALQLPPVKNDRRSTGVAACRTTGLGNHRAPPTPAARKNLKPVSSRNPATPKQFPDTRQADPSRDDA